MLERSQKADEVGEAGAEATGIMGSGPPGSVLLYKTGGDKRPMLLVASMTCRGSRELGEAFVLFRILLRDHLTNVFSILTPSISPSTVGPASLCILRLEL